MTEGQVVWAAGATGLEIINRQGNTADLRVTTEVTLQPNTTRGEVNYQIGIVNSTTGVFTPIDSGQLTTQGGTGASTLTKNFRLNTLMYTYTVKVTGKLYYGQNGTMSKQNIFTDRTITP